MQGTEQKREASLEDIRRVAKILAKATSNNENEATIAIKAAYARMRRDGVTIVDLLTLPLQDLYQKPLERLIPIVMADSKGLTPAQRKIAIDALLHVVREKFSPIPKSHQSEPPRPPPPPPQPPPNTRDEQRREYEKRRQSEESARRAGQGRAAPPPPPPPPPRPPPERPKPPPMAQEPRETVPYHYVRPANPVRGGATVGYAALFLFVLYLFWGNVGISGSKPAAATVPEASAVSSPNLSEPVRNTQVPIALSMEQATRTAHTRFNASDGLVIDSGEVIHLTGTENGGFMFVVIRNGKEYEGWASNGTLEGATQ